MVKSVKSHFLLVESPFLLIKSTFLLVKHNPISVVPFLASTLKDSSALVQPGAPAGHGQISNNVCL